MLALKMIALLGLLSSVTLFLFWIIRSLIVTYEEGAAIRAQIQGEGIIEDGGFQFISCLSGIGAFFLPLIDRLEAKNQFDITAKLNGWNRQLFRAGIRPAMSPKQFLSLLFAFGVVGGIAGVILFYLLVSGILGALCLGFPLGTLAGFFVPVHLLKKNAASRVILIEKHLPFALEFLLLSLEANASFEMALREYCDQFSSSPLAHEFRLVLRNAQHGIRLAEALSQMGWRIQSEALSSVILAIVTGYETGQPVKEVLKQQADSARQQRFKAAEEIAKTASVKATFPLFIVMIAVFLLIVAPLAIKMSRSF
jgi:tight adherence protein C